MVPRYIDKAGATFVNAVDPANFLSDIYGFKAIPNGLLVDENGILRYMQFGGFDIRKPDTYNLVSNWVVNSTVEISDNNSVRLSADEYHGEANGLFQQGLEMYELGNVTGALLKWREGAALEPDNYIIRKQIWAVEYPEKFYSSDAVDSDWQREQLRKGV